MRARRHDRVGDGQPFPWSQIDSVLVACFRGRRDRVVHINVDTVALQLADHVDYARISQIRYVLLERQSEHVDLRALDLAAAGDHLFYRLLGDVLAHVVVDAPAGEDDLRVIADHFRLVRQVIRIDADAVSADQTGTKREKVPFGSRRLQYLERIETKTVEDERQLVHERD